MPSVLDGATDSAPDSECTWTSLSGQGLQFKRWNDEDQVVVFDPLTCDTHLLEPLAAEVLVLIAASPRSSRAVTELVAPLLDVPESERIDIEALVDSCLEKLQRAGLIENCKH